MKSKSLPPIPEGYEITVATLQDVRGMGEVHKQCYRTAYLNPAKGATREAIDRYTNGKFQDRMADHREARIDGKQPESDKTVFLLVAHHSQTEQVVGFVEATRPNRHCSPTADPIAMCSLDAWYVHPDHQDRGVGKALRSRAMSYLCLAVQASVVAGTQAIENYQKNGFVARPDIMVPMPSAPYEEEGIELDQILMVCNPNPYFNPDLHPPAAS